MPQPVHWRSWSWMVLWRPTRPDRTNTPKRCPFHYRGLECKSRKSRNTWRNRQIWPQNTEWSRAKANRVLPRECTAVAAAKSLQSCLTLCNPRDGSPPGSSIPGILQARTLECVAISFANAWKWKVEVKSPSRVGLLKTPWTAAYQAPLYMGFSRQEYWSGLPLPSPRKRIGQSKHPLPKTQEKTLHMDITRWSTPKSDWLYSLQPKMEKLYTVSKNKTRSWLWLRSWTPIAKFRLKSKKIGKTTRPLRYDLNEIPYDYTLEVRNRFKGLDLIDRVPDELWMEVHDIVQETGIKTISMEKKCKKAKWLTSEALQRAVKRREVKNKGEKERYKHLNTEFQRRARRDKKDFLSNQCKDIQGKNRMGKTRDLFRKILPRT